MAASKDPLGMNVDDVDVIRIARDRFKLRSVLGEGGFGRVYEAWDAKRAEVVALKILRNIAGEPLFRLKEEFKLAHPLVHPNVVGPDGIPWRVAQIPAMLAPNDQSPTR